MASNEPSTSRCAGAPAESSSTGIPAGSTAPVITRPVPIPRMASVAACCIPHSTAMKIVGFVSCIFGMVLATASALLSLINPQQNIRNRTDSPASSISSRSPSSHDATLFSCTPVNWLLVVGIAQTVSSVTLLVGTGSYKDFQHHDRVLRLMKIWTVSHVLTSLGTLVYLSHLFMYTNLTESLHPWTKLFLSFLGINFCTVIFLTLVMIEFLITHRTLVCKAAAANNAPDSREIEPGSTRNSFRFKTI